MQNRGNFHGCSSPTQFSPWLLVLELRSTRVSNYAAVLNLTYHPKILLISGASLCLAFSLRHSEGWPHYELGGAYPSPFNSVTVAHSSKA